MIADLTDAIGECSVRVTVTRHLSVGFDKGRKVDPRTKEIAASVSITPLTGNDLKRLGEGQLVSGSKLIISPVELFTAKSSVCRIADVLHYRGLDYQISVVKDWLDLGGFFECVGMRINR